MKALTRRNFLSQIRNTALVAPLFALVDVTTAFAKEVVYTVADLAETKKNPSIAALKYVKDASNATTRTVAKSGVAAKDQDCANCNFYKDPGLLGKEKVGKCLMFQNQVVHAAGWCSVWSKTV